MEITNEQVESLAKFALEILEDFPDLSSYDGGDIQELAEKHKLLIPQTMHAPCGEDCFCDTYFSDSEWQDGVTCYHIVDWLDRDAEHRNEAVDAGQSCPSCDGKGNLRNSKEILVVCERCNGTGQI